jgi:uncharacterized protein YndB with AHSA1/START domain
MAATWTVAPIRKEMIVKASRQRAFNLFVSRISEWWFAGKGIGQSPFKEIILEPRAGGRWFERAADGVETNWGEVLEWQPPARVLLAWRIDANWRFDPGLETRLEISFQDAGNGGTRILLEHRDLDRLGEAGRKTAEAMDGGWGALLERFAAVAERETMQR